MRKSLYCPYCNSQLMAMMEWQGHSLGDAFVGMECLNYECAAEWNSVGEPTIESRLPECYSE